MIPRRLQQVGALSFGWLLMASFLACSAATGPVGGGGLNAPGGNAVGGNNDLAAPAAATGFNPGSIEAGAEGHGQEKPEDKFAAVARHPDGRSNCGVLRERSQEIFAEGEGRPFLLISYGGGDSGPFTPAKSFEMRGDGRVAMPTCPLSATLEGGAVRATFLVKVQRLILSYTDAAGNFFQSEPKVVACSLLCAEAPCETCLDLKPESEFPEDERLHRLEPLPVNSNVGNLGPLPALPSKESVELREFDGNGDLLHLNPRLLTK